MADPTSRSLNRSALCLLAALAGCAAKQVADPSFAVTVDVAARDLATMEHATTKPALERPVVILDGINAWGFDAAKMKRRIAARADGQIVTVCYPFAFNFQDCRKAVIKKVDCELGKAGDDETVEVDVIGESMGGLVGVYAALEDPALGKRLRIHRLYTISAPLTGAKQADALAWLSPIPLHRDLRSTSALRESLRLSPPAYPVVSYSRLEDNIVGAKFASIDGEGVYWVANRPCEHAHFDVMDDPRILADLFRRLRGEPIWTEPTTSPLPKDID